MTEEMAKGSNIPLSAAAVRAVVRWTPGGPDVDASALLLGADGRVRSDDDFVFYNQPTHPSRLVQHRAKQHGPGTATDTVEVRLALLPDRVQRVVIGASADGEPFARVREPFLLLYDAADPARVLARFPLGGNGTATALLCGELYRRHGGWKFRALGHGYASGLQGLAMDFGVAVEDASDGGGTPGAPAGAPPGAPVGTGPGPGAEGGGAAPDGPTGAEAAGADAAAGAASGSDAEPAAGDAEFTLPPQGPQFRRTRR